MKKFVKFLQGKNKEQNREENEEYDYLFKMICVGDENCGKKDAIVKFSQGFFQDQYKLTIGIEFAEKTIELLNGKKVYLQIWDTGGQERFQYVRPMYYRGAMGAIIFFNISIRESFEHVPKWIEEIHSNLGEIPILIVGNLLNIEDERVVGRKEAEELAFESQAYYMDSFDDLIAIDNIFSVISYLMIGIDIPDEYLYPRLNLDFEPKKVRKLELREIESDGAMEKQRIIAKDYMGTMFREIKDDIETEKPTKGKQQQHVIRDPEPPSEKSQKLDPRDLKLSQVKNEKIVEKLKKIMKVSTKIRLDIMRDVLKMDFSEFNEKLFDWAVEFGFKIDGDYIIIENSDVEGFINQLDKQFELWENREK